MSQIYKLNHTEGDNIKHIYIFAGNETIDISDYTDSKGNPIFSHEELSNITKKKIPVEIITSFAIHGDDTIGMIKKKLVHALNLDISTKELYLFGITEEKLIPSIIYKQLTQNESIPLTETMLCQFLLNIIENGCVESEIANTCEIIGKLGSNISYDDFTNILDWDAIQSYIIPIGERLVHKKVIPFVANPYNCTFLDNFIKESMPGIVTTQNTSLLFEVGQLCLNNIFFCLAEEVLTYTSTQTKLEEISILNLYFPLLVTIDKINSLTMLQDKRYELHDKEEKLIGQDFDKYNEQVNLFYDIYNVGNANSPLNYLNNTPGITAISLVIHPIHNIKFPLDILFKLIHSTRIIPLIKYNPGKTKENIYRLYTANNTATDGKKIPFLYTQHNNKKTFIIKLSKILSFSKRVSFYINIIYNDNKYNLTCSFSENGNIHINIPSINNLNKPLSLQQIEEIIHLSIKEPILDKIRSYLEQSGYSYISFDSLTDKNIEIESMTWVSQLKITAKINLKKYISCLSTIFAIEQDSLSKTSDVINMKYKRVSSYNQMNAQDAFITELRKLNVQIPEIINQLQANFKLSQQEAELKFGPQKHNN